MCVCMRSISEHIVILNILLILLTIITTQTTRRAEQKKKKRHSSVQSMSFSAIVDDLLACRMEMGRAQLPKADMREFVLLLFMFGCGHN